ncbi:hypothetical protein [Agrococcus jejuensis]|uniref:Lipoprotein antigen n=1 Tax=Agrococcus jejuensis TaxID=399736 RepID=A0A1G7ZSX4_9MICO|nr:hypothetical protein [Agrococcus jejuensis]SDH11737.1 hypothetical protein SAMN04489720_0094 [Agrococcus jejuensis]
MPRTRILAIAIAALSTAALSGCIVSPPAAAPVQPQPSAPAASDPAPTDPTTDPTPTDPAPTDGGSGGTDTGSTVTIDGQPAGAWASTVDCWIAGDGALLTSTADDGSGSLLGTLANTGGTWTAEGILVTTDTELYVQQDESVPATMSGSSFSTEFVATTISGGTVTIAVTAECTS